jgi:hypothetical protein
MAMGDRMKTIAKLCSEFSQLLLAGSSEAEAFRDPALDPDLSTWRAYRQREQAARIEEEADVMIHDFGVDAYSEARRRELEATAEARARHWTLVALAIARKTYEKRGDERPSRSRWTL